MLNSMLAVIKSSDGLPGILKYAKEARVKSLALVSDNCLATDELDADFEVTTAKLADYRPDDLDKQVLEEIKGFLDRLFLENPKLKGTLKLNENDLAGSMTYPFSTLAQHWFRAALTMKRIVSLHKPDVVVTDEYWHKYAELAGIDVLNVSVNRHAHPFIKQMKRKMLFLLWLATGISVRLFFAVLTGKILNTGRKEMLTGSEIYLLGSHFHNRSFYPIWNRITEKNSKTAEIFFGYISWPLFRIIRSSGYRGVAEGLVDLKDVPQLIYTYIKTAVNYYHADIRGPITISKKHISSFGLQLDRFFLLNLPMALLFSNIGHRFRSFPNLRRIILSLPNSWQSTSLSHILKKSTVETVSVTHGMVLDPISYRSNTSLKITWGAFDANNLSSYSNDESYISLKSTPAGLKNAKNSEHVPGNTGLIQITSKNGNGSGSISEDIFKGKNACILPSSNLKDRELLFFLNMSIKHLADNKDKYQLDYIVVKIHPRSDIWHFSRHIEKIIRDNITVPVFLSKNACLSVLLKSCSFALCTPSSIMLDLLKCNVPFSIYTAGVMLDKKFILRMPPWMHFKTAADLESVTSQEISDFSHTAISLQTLYWGDNETAGYDLDGIASRLSY